MDPETTKLLIINLPNLIGLVVLSAVLWKILIRNMDAYDKRIVFLEAALTACLEQQYEQDEEQAKQ